MLHRCGILLLVCLALGCAQPKYWIDGLSLPPGAVEVDRNESESTSSSRPDLPINLPAFNKQTSRSLSVSFDCDQEWASVTAHFDSILLKSGYTDTSQSYRSAPGLDAESQRIMDSTRFYTIANGNRTVILSDNSMIIEMMAQYGVSGNSGKMGRYSLMVMDN